MPPWGTLDATDLVAWWTLGDGGGDWPIAVRTPNFCLDQSGNGHHLDAYNAARWEGVGDPPIWITDPDSPALPDTHITPACPQDADGGAVKFKLTQYQWITFPYQLCLSAPVTMQEHFVYTSGVGSGATCMFWVAFIPYADTVVGIAPFGGISELGVWPYLFGDWGHVFGIESRGTHAGFDPYTGEFYYLTQDSQLTSSGGVYGGAGWSYRSDPLAPYVWHHFACVLEKTVGGPSSFGTGRYRRRFYHNGTQVVDFEGDAYDVAVSAPEMGLTIGGSWSDDIRFAHCAGQLDEFSVWRRPLSEAEIGEIIFGPSAKGVHAAV